MADYFKKINFNLYGDKKSFVKYVNKKNIYFENYVNYRKVPKILKNSDLLLMPYSDNVEVRSANLNTANYCSPLKMFDYLAAGKIILSSKLDGICEVLKNEKNSIIINSHNFDAWKTVINNLINKKINLKGISKRALITAKSYTWNERVEKLLKLYKLYLINEKKI